MGVVSFKSIYQRSLGFINVYIPLPGILFYHNLCVGLYVAKGLYRWDNYSYLNNILYKLYIYIFFINWMNTFTFRFTANICNTVILSIVYENIENSQH